MIEAGELVGNLFQVPDKWWGFEAFGRKNHPGACVGYVPPGFKATLLKGTDPKSARYHDVHVVVDCDNLNGLKKPTAFAIKPLYFSVRKVALLKDVRIGQLASSDLGKMQSELLRLFGEEE